MRRTPAAPTARLLASAVAAMLAATAAPVLADLVPDIPEGNHTVRLELVAELDDDVIAIAAPDDGSGRLFLVAPSGKIFILAGGALLASPFLDDPAIPADRAMSGLAFHPDYAQNSKLYVISGEPTSNPSTAHYAPPQDDIQTAFDNVLVEYRADAQNPDVVDMSTKRELLRVHQADKIHNMNDLTFGGDGYLYIAMGDGGATLTGTPTHNNTNGQRVDNPYGAILRIDVDSIGPNGRYAIPAGNPLANGDVPEIYAWGVRNPWRITADRSTGSVYTAVNGHNHIEYILRVELNRNYGWDTKVGSFLFDNETGHVSVDPEPDPQFTPPLAEYDHEQGLGSCIGGFVYRGSALPALAATYLFSDYVGGRIIAMNITTGALEFVQVDPEGPQPTPFREITWGEDAGGELYLGTSAGRVYKLRPPGKVAVQDPAPTPRRGLRLEQNAPNPFNPATTIRFELETNEHARLRIFGPQGRLVRTLVDQPLTASQHTVIWDGRDADGHAVGSGTYYYQVEAGGDRLVRAMVLVR